LPNRKETLHAYLLGRVPFDEWLALQRRLVYEVSGERDRAVLVFCEHSHGISIGREGSAGHIIPEDDELRSLGWPVHWVNRGSGCLLHLPGQLSVYPILALQSLKINVQEYLDRLHATVRNLLAEMEIAAILKPESHGVWVADRRIAHVGIAVRDWVAYHGISLNVETNLKLFRLVHCDGEQRPMTSIARECRLRVRPAAVRLRLLAHFAAQFGFERISRFHHHPALTTKASAHAILTPPG
jgi:lipoyl(octanoyl) transferase